jgi:hypothetical protein
MAERNKSQWTSPFEFRKGNYRICSNSSRPRFEAALKLKPHLSVFEKIQAAFEL